MAELATNIGVVEMTAKTTNVAVSRGYRVTLDSSGTVSAAAIGVRGDYVALADVLASDYGNFCPMQAGARVTAYNGDSATATVGDAAYSAASGAFSKTSTNAVLVGKWAQTTAANTLGVVLIETVA